MKSYVERRCIVCRLIFCCSDCRWKHENSTHGLQFDCPICRELPFLCRPGQLSEPFIHHLAEEHLPLHCSKCDKVFEKMDDFNNIDKCSSISELIKEQTADVEEKFESIYVKFNTEDEPVKNSKTAIITPIVRKNSNNIVDYASSEEDEETVREVMKTPHPLAQKTSKYKQRAATPHVKKLLALMKQKNVEEIDEIYEDVDGNHTETTPKNNPVPESDKEMTTPTSHLPNLLKLAQIVSTSTPTHPVTGGWLFPEQGAESPLSEIENTESPSQSINNEASKTSDTLPPKLKSIINTSRRVTSQDSNEKHVTFQDSNNEGSTKKKVKFAEDTVFQEHKIKRVFRKPKRMLTPGPQKPRFCYNPRFQALINRFENSGLIMARTPKNNREEPQTNTPALGDATNLPARAINFKEDSPIVDNISKDSNDSFKTCIASPDVTNAITALTADIAGSLQTCLNSAMKTTEEDTEIQFKFVITKKKVKRFVEEDGREDRIDEMERQMEINKQNLWTSVAKAVKKVFWGDQSSSTYVSTTPHSTLDSTTSSASKRKLDELSDCDFSPLNHKRQKYEGKIHGRPPLRPRPWRVSGLRTSRSAEQQSLLKDMADDGMNLSF